MELSNSMIVRFINRWLVKLKDVKYLAKANFPIKHPNAKLAEYYQQLENYWVKFFESLNLVQVGSGLTMPQRIHTPQRIIFSSPKRYKFIRRSVLFHDRNVWSRINSSKRRFVVLE